MTLVAEGLEVGYKNKPSILQNLHLEVREGEFLAVLGPNGSGKSTLLRTLAGVLRPRKGSVLLDGQSTKRFSPENRARQIGYLPQEVAPALPYRVDEVVALGVKSVARDDAKNLAHKIEKALLKVDAHNLSGQLLDELSGGEKRRVLLAGVLAQQPRFLLLDEPASMLDLGHQSATFRTLKGLSKEGLGVVCATHDPNLALAHASHMALVNKGEIQALGKPRAVLASRAFKSHYGEAVRFLDLPDGDIAVLPK